MIIRWWGIAAIAVAAGAAPPLHAQVARDTALLEPLTVSATRVPVSANAVTATVDVISGEELRNRGVTFVADALAELPSAAYVQGGGIGGVGALFLRGGESDYVKVLVDGVPVNDAGGAFNFANLTTDNVERIEVVRGPVSVLYGSDAVAGLVQVFTRRGNSTAELVGSVEAGTDATTHAAVTAAGGTPRLEWSGGASRVASSGMYEFNNDYGNTVLSGRLAGRPDAVTTVAATLRYHDAKAAFPTDFSGVANDSNQHSTSRQIAAGIEVGRYLSAVVETRAALSLARTRTGFDDQPDHAGDASGFGFRSERDTRGNRTLLDARVNVRPLEMLVITAGGQYEHESESIGSETESDFGDGPFVETSDFDEQRSTAGLYTQAVAEFASELAITLNGRLDRNSAFGTFGTARAGVAYRFAAGTRLRGSAGTAYKAPTFCEQFCSQPFIVGDSTLDPERAATWELAVEQLLAGGRVGVAATWFSQRFSDRIEYRPAPPPLPNYANLTAAEACGLELSAFGSPAEGVRLRAAYTWLDTEVTDGGGDPAFTEGERLLRRPSHSLSAGATVSVVERARFGLSVVRVGARDDTNFETGSRDELPAYTTVGATAAFDVMRRSGALPSLTVSLRGENLLDEQYEQTFGFPGRGRMVFAGIRAGL